MDLRKFSVNARANRNPGVAVACVEVEAEAVDNDGTVLGDFTGANAIEFLFRVRGFTVAQHKRLAEDIAHKIVRMRLGAE